MTPIGQTDRGFFDFADFVDGYGNNVIVRESSAASGPHLWVFIDGEVHLNEPARPIVGIEHGVAKAHASMHLNMEQVEKLRDSLSEYIEFVKTRWEVPSCNVCLDAGGPGPLDPCPHCGKYGPLPPGDDGRLNP